MLHKRFAGACDHASWVFDGLVRAMRRAGSGPTASTRTQMAARGAVSRSSSRTPDRANAPSHRTRRCVLPLPWHKTAPVSLHGDAACGATDDLETCVFRRGKRAFMRDASGFFPAMIGKKSRSARTVESSAIDRASDRVGAVRIARVICAAHRHMRVRRASTPSIAPRMRAECRSHAMGFRVRERRRSRMEVASPIGTNVADQARCGARVGAARCTSSARSECDARRAMDSDRRGLEPGRTKPANQDREVAEARVGDPSPGCVRPVDAHLSPVAAAAGRRGSVPPSGA